MAIPIGEKGEQKILVTSAVAINFLGLEGARVLSTPNMIKFMEWTSDAKLRHPVYLGLRDDKKPTDVTREEKPPVRAQRTTHAAAESDCEGCAH